MSHLGLVDPAIDGHPFSRANVSFLLLIVRNSFITKCIKSWLAQGTSGRRVTLLPGKLILHINRAVVVSNSFSSGRVCVIYFKTGENNLARKNQYNKPNIVSTNIKCIPEN